MVRKIISLLFISLGGIVNKASPEAATGPGILEQNTERRKGAYAPGGYGGLKKIAAGSFTGTDRLPIFM